MKILNASRIQILKGDRREHRSPAKAFDPRKTYADKSVVRRYLAAASTLMSKTLSLPGSTFKVNGLLIAS